MPRGSARRRRSCSATSRSHQSWPSTCASCASCRSAPAASPSSCRCRSSPFRPCSGAPTGCRRSRARRTSSTPPCSASRWARRCVACRRRWVKMGLDVATEALRWGVNDLGGTLMEESISRMAGSYHGVRLEPADLIGAAHAAGRPAAERSTLYEIRRRYELASRRGMRATGPRERRAAAVAVCGRRAAGGVRRTPRRPRQRHLVDGLL